MTNSQGKFLLDQAKNIIVWKKKKLSQSLSAETSSLHYWDISSFMNQNEEIFSIPRSCSKYHKMSHHKKQSKPALEVMSLEITEQGTPKFCSFIKAKNWQKLSELTFSELQNLTWRNKGFGNLPYTPENLEVHARNQG